MTSPRKLATALITATLLITATGCTSSTPDLQGSTVTTRNAEMPPLPQDQDAAKAVVRKMMMKEAIVLLKASGLKYSYAQFRVPFAPYTDNNAQNGDLLIQFQPCTDQQAQAMTAAIWANGWEQGSISHGVHVRKGPLDLHWGNDYGGCDDFRMTTVNISQHMRITDDITHVPELAAFKAIG
jgi:hypothetical protein